MKSADFSGKVTVLMGVYNGEAYLQEALDSIMGQTFSDFSFLIIDDASTDNTAKIIKSYDDPRIFYHKNEANLGIGKTVRKGMEMIHSKYVIRVDADDISYPERFATQVKFMETHPEIAIAGTHFDVIWGISQKNEIIETPLEIRTRALFECPIIQPSIIINNETLRKNQLNYDARFEVAGDYALFMDTLMVGELAIIPQKLMAYRRHKKQLSSTKYTLQDQNSTTKRIELLRRLGGIQLNDRERSLYMAYSFHRTLSQASDLGEVKTLIRSIRRVYFTQNAFPIDRDYYLKLEYERLRVLLIENKSHGFSLLSSYIRHFGRDFKIWMFLGLLLRIIKFKLVNAVRQ